MVLGRFVLADLPFHAGSTPLEIPATMGWFMTAKRKVDRFRVLHWRSVCGQLGWDLSAGQSVQLELDPADSTRLLLSVLPTTTAAAAAAAARVPRAAPREVPASGQRVSLAAAAEKVAAVEKNPTSGSLVVLPEHLVHHRRCRI